MATVMVMHWPEVTKDQYEQARHEVEVAGVGRGQRVKRPEAGGLAEEDLTLMDIRRGEPTSTEAGALSFSPRMLRAGAAGAWAEVRISHAG